MANTHMCGNDKCTGYKVKLSHHSKRSPYGYRAIHNIKIDKYQYFLIVSPQKTHKILEKEKFRREITVCQINYFEFTYFHFNTIIKTEQTAIKNVTVSIPPNTVCTGNFKYRSSNEQIQDESNDVYLLNV